MGVVFLTSALLAGLALVVGPLIIHLISKRRARRVRFAAMEFVLKSQKRTARSVRLRQLLLLLLRTLLVAAIAAALARPVWRHEPEQQATTAPLAVVLAVDVSASMRAELDGKSAFERARQKATQALRELPEDVRAALVTCGPDVVDVVGSPSFDRRPVVDALAAMKPGYGRSDLQACVARAREIARLVPGEGERRVVVFSDLAAHAFPGGAPGSDGRGLVVEWVPAFDEEPPPNHGLTSVVAERVAGPSGDGIQVRFTASRHGGVDVEVPADLLIGGRRVARLVLPLGPGKSLERTFTHGVAASTDEPAQQELKLVLGDDALSVDHEAVLPVDLPRPVKVLLVDGAPQPIPFRDEVFYLESALRQTRGSRARLSIDVLAPDRLDAAALASARVVVLANVERLEDAAVKALVDFVKAGGGLFVTMGDQVDVEWMNAALKDVLPGELRGAKGQALLDDAAVAETLAFTRFLADHPALRPLSGGEGSDELQGLSRVRTHTLMLMEPDATAEREILARFSNEAPALVERVVENGRVMLLATTVDRDWTDLAIRPGYLPLMQQIVLYLAGALSDHGPRILTVGQPREIAAPRGASHVEVHGPDGQKQRIAVAAPAPETPDARGVVAFTGTDAPGLYRVFAVQQGGDPRELTGERFSVLVDPRESDLTRASADALEGAVPEGAVVRGGEPEDGDTPLWPMLLVLAVLFVVGEAALLRRYAA